MDIGTVDLPHEQKPGSASVRADFLVAAAWLSFGAAT
jgi:hypothetical protein